MCTWVQSIALISIWSVIALHFFLHIRTIHIIDVNVEGKGHALFLHICTINTMDVNKE